MIVLQRISQNFLGAPVNTYCCEKCKMEIKPMVCATCNEQLVDNTIEKDGNKIAIAECPKCQGKVKAPQCCGSTMKCT